MKLEVKLTVTTVSGFDSEGAGIDPQNTEVQAFDVPNEDVAITQAYALVESIYPNRYITAVIITNVVILQPRGSA